ncbi:MAG: thioredoxin family protein [Cyclobacteriaceae bacterium]|nr:thioredoxin family protein [Cyclobacteriaceae bacterium]
MKGLFTVLILLCLSVSSEWLTSIEEAKRIAQEKKQHILLNFSGSDWCAPCIKMKKEIFSQEIFTQYADQHLVLVKADFPRLKKNQLDVAQVKHNEALAERYNSQGKFPYTLLLDAAGNIIKEWDGYKNMTPGEFVSEISKAVHE